MSDDQTSEVNLDSLHTIEVEHAQVDDTLRRGLLSAGNYVTDPAEFGPMTALVNKMEDKDDAGNVTGERLVITLMGRGRAKVREDGEVKLVEGRLPRIQISPDARRKIDRETKEELGVMDNKTNLYAQAVKAYQAHFKERPKHVGQVVDYLTNYPAQFRIIQIGVPTKNRPEPDGEPMNWCMGISAIRG